MFVMVKLFDVVCLQKGFYYFFWHLWLRIIYIFIKARGPTGFLTFFYTIR
jgi:hypothetical protein